MAAGVVAVVDQQFSQVAARYPFHILVGAVTVWAYTVGADATADEVIDHVAPNILEHPPPPFGDDSRNRELLRWLEIQAETHVDDPGRSDMPMQTVFDPYIPWVAQVLYHYWTAYEAAALRLGLGPAGDGFTIPTPIRQRVARARKIRDTPAVQTGAAYQAYHDAKGWLTDHLRLLAQWAEARDRDLTRYQTLEELEPAYRSARKWAQKQARKQPPVEGTILHRYPDGWTMQVLDTQESLDYEGEHQRHCVADYAELEDPDAAIYSLRNADGRPVVTIEHNLLDDRYAQLAGFTNQDVTDPGLLRRIACFRLEHDPPKLPPEYRPPTESEWSWEEWSTGHGDEIIDSPAERELGLRDELVSALLAQQIYDWYGVCKPQAW